MDELPEFIKGHIYKIYSQNPDQYVIVKFTKQEYRSRPMSDNMRSPSHKIYFFITIADNTLSIAGLGNQSYGLLHSNNRAYFKDTLSKMTVVELSIENLPQFLNAYYIGPEFENALKIQSGGHEPESILFT